MNKITKKDFKEYLKAKKLSERTIKDYMNYYRNFDEFVGKEGLDQQVINRFVLTYTSNVARTTLKHIFDFYNLDEFKVPRPSGRRNQKYHKPISKKDLKLLRKILYNHTARFGLMCDLSYHCALRREEVLNVKVTDFQFEEWMEDKKKGCRLKIRGKGSKERIVIVPPKLTQWIVNYISSMKYWEGRLFRIGKTVWQRAFHKAVQKIGANYTIHDLRRTRATRWYEEGKSLIQIKNRLGHANISTTQIYINPDKEKELNTWESEVSK